MLSKKVFNAIAMTTTKEDKDLVIAEVLNHIHFNYDYNNKKANHLLEMLVDSTAIVKPEDVNLSYFDTNKDQLIYRSNEYNIKDITIKDIDNIDCLVWIEFKYIEKVNEDRDDISYTTGKSLISYLDFPEILNNVKIIEPVYEI